ncbi:FAD-dependent oxidoreductase [Actinophytocola sp.]|uniref:FAD-dependent oxidoreductase n=1 Tax=Actinophytocola sp. TaxID=1872138 RepID=UPI002D4D3C7D|nr:FAD-dependent oxidoreductase [Actinophytocola sp.]HYQ66106.1 FAD-dependent oxidoreductase [Actinophytocola sp.]
MRVGVVGAGVAGALLAWRLRRSAPRIAVEVYTGGPAGGDASGASGGLVRGFERDSTAGRLAVAGLAELRADPALRAVAAYQEVGSVYVLPPGADASGPVRVIEEALPGSATVLTGAGLAARYPFRGLPDGVTAVAERHAGYLSPARLRAAVLGWLADGGATVRPEPVAAVAPGPALRLAGGAVAGYDAVVVAAGAWTPALLTASGLPTGGLRVKQIQYTVYEGRPDGLGPFVLEPTGMWGRPAGTGFLLGLPCDRWDVDPSDPRPDDALVERVAAQARELLGHPPPGHCPHRTTVSADCYREPPGLALRALGGGVFTFTGGSGGAAKTVLAASRVAAATLVR